MSEEFIIAQIKKGVDVDKGFKWLVNKHQEKIYWHIRSFLKSHEDANDVMQNTFIKAYRNIDKFKSESKFYTWLYRIASNECLNFVKKQKRYQITSTDDHELVLNRLKADPYFNGSKAQMLFQSAIETLPEKQRLVFNMKYFDNLPYKEISEILDTSVGALKASFHHASKKIETFIKENAYE